MTPDNRSIDHLTRKYPELVDLKIRIQKLAGDKDSPVVETAIERLHTQIAEGIGYFMATRSLRSGAPEFDFINDLHLAANLVDRRANLLVAQSEFVQNKGKIWLSSLYLRDFLHYNQGVIKKFPYQILPREATMHEMQHLWQWENNPLQLQEDLELKAVQGQSAWITTFSELEAVEVADRMEREVSTMLLAS